MRIDLHPALFQGFTETRADFQQFDPPREDRLLDRCFQIKIVKKDSGVTGMELKKKDNGCYRVFVICFVNFLERIRQIVRKSCKTLSNVYHVSRFKKKKKESPNLFRTEISMLRSV